MEWAINGLPVHLVIQYRKVKGINITVKLDGTVKVTAPIGLKEQVLMEVLRRRAGWIEKKLREMESQRKIFPYPHRFLDGEIFWFLGQAHPLKVKKGRRNGVRLEEGRITVTVPEAHPEQVKKALMSWYQRQAKKIINRRIKKFEKQICVHPQKVELGEWKGKWGICYSKEGILRFNWKIAKLPEELIDYIIVHEMLHLKHPNHGREFWSDVRRVLPDYGWRRTMLKRWKGALVW